MSEILQQIQDAAKGTQNIQRDITVVKSSVGVSTTPLNAANFSGGKATTTSWAQVAAQAKGSPLPPPPVQQGAHTSKTPPTVTAYKDRVVTVKLKDHGIAQRYRTHSAAWTRQQVQTSIHDNAATKSVKVVAAHQLKSGDIQIFTSTTAEATQLKENKGWLRGLGEHAELIVPTYGVIVHGVSTNSINIKDQKATIQQMLADNYTVIPNAEISYVGWLTKEATLKRASSIVVEFTDPEMANAIIYAGMVWDGQIHQCQLYDRACRVKQCFRCYNYGHIGTQCNASQTCGYCAEQHETKHCRQKGVEGFISSMRSVQRCSYCMEQCLPSKKEGNGKSGTSQTDSGASTGTSPLKDNTTRPRTDNTRNTIPPRRRRIPATSDSGSNDNPEARRSYANLQHQEPIPSHKPSTKHLHHTNRSTDQCNSTRHLYQHRHPQRLRYLLKQRQYKHRQTLSVEEEWATPATQQEPTQQQLDSLIDPQTQSYGGALLPHSSTGGQSTPTILVPTGWNRGSICHAGRRHLAGQHDQQRQRVVTQYRRRLNHPHLPPWQPTPVQLKERSTKGVNALNTRKSTTTGQHTTPS